LTFIEGVKLMAKKEETKKEETKKEKPFEGGTAIMHKRLKNKKKK